MKCPQCAHTDTSVIDSRIIEDGSVIRRRRQCESCGYRFSTLEKRMITELLVIKKDGTKELYEKAKVKKALILAFAKRNIQTQLLDEMINQLEIQRSKGGNEISSKQIGEDILALLKQTDPVAYVRFASVYKQFDSLEDFQKMIH